MLLSALRTIQNKENSTIRKGRLKVSKLFLEHDQMESKNNWTNFGSAFALGIKLLQLNISPLYTETNQS